MKLFPMLVIAAALCAAPASALTVTADFPGGSAEVHRLDLATGHLEISPAGRAGRGWPCWWYFRVDDAQPGQTLTLHVTPSQQPFRGQQRLPAAWSLPLRPAISVDDVHWQQADPGVITRESGTYKVVAPAARFWMAWGPPFLPTHADALLDAVAKELPGAERFVLATTRQERPVAGIRCGTPGAPDVVWVQARQHAWEAGGSWVGCGFLKWIASDHPEAEKLRANAEIFFIPVMDVDNVILGAGGKEAVPRDHNRDWSADPVYPEVAAAQQRIAALAQAGRLRLFLDLHNPGASEQTPYYFGPHDYDAMPAQRRNHYDRFLAISIKTMTEPLAIHPQYKVASYLTSDEERQRVSGNWVRDHSGDNTVALTLETAWNTPHSTTEGYQHVGRGLAQTVARHLSEGP